MNKYLKTFLQAIIAGICISIGGIVYVSVCNENRVLASFLFALGLFTIIVYQFNLFTGKVGYIFDNKPKYLLDLLLIFCGNLVGCLATGYGFRLTRAHISVAKQLETMCNAKLNDNILSILILAVFCGALMYIAVNTQRKDIHPLFKLAAIFFSVAVFILCSFEHVIANMFYFSAANMWSWKTILYILIMGVGNGIGSLIIWGFEKIGSKKIPS